MILRFKWYKLIVPNGLQNLGRDLLRSQLTAETDCGFRIRTEDRSGIHLRFAWRSTVVAMTVDEDGNPSPTPIATVNFIDLKFFSLNSAVYLRVENPGKSSRALMNEIERVAGYGFAIQPIIFADSEPPKFFANFDQARLTGLKLINVVFDRHVVGRIELASKEHIDLKSIADSTGKAYVVDTATFDVAANMIRGQLSFNRNGLVRVSERIAPQFLDMFESSIEEFAKRES